MIKVLTLLALSTLGAAPAFADCDEEKVAVESLPSAVRDAVERQFPGAEILEAEREHGLFEVELRTAEGGRRELKLQEDGSSPTPGEHEEEEDD